MTLSPSLRNGTMEAPTTSTETGRSEIQKLRGVVRASWEEGSPGLIKKPELNEPIRDQSGQSWRQLLGERQKLLGVVRGEVGPRVLGRSALP